VEAAKRYAEIRSRERIRPADAIQLACAAAAVQIFSSRTIAGSPESSFRASHLSPGLNEYRTNQGLEPLIGAEPTNKGFAGLSWALKAKEGSAIRPAVCRIVCRYTIRERRADADASVVLVIHKGR